MKKYTRFLAFLLAFTMLLSCSTSAFAENAGSIDEYYQFVDEYLDAQREAAVSSPDPVLSDVAKITKPNTEPGDLMPPVTIEEAVYSLKKTGLKAVAPTASGDDPEDPDGNKVVTGKKTTYNGDGTYKVQLEAYATGEKYVTEVTEAVPTDIILVLDQSGSMDEAFTSYTNAEFNPYAKEKINSEYMDEFINTQNIWYKPDPDKDEYVQVQVRRENPKDYRYEDLKIPTGYVEKYTYRATLKSHSDNNELFYSPSEDVFKQVKVNFINAVIAYYMSIEYVEGGQVESLLGGFISNKVPQKKYWVRQPADFTYVYYYTVEENGVQKEVVITTSSGKDGKMGEEVAPLEDEDYSFYERKAGTETQSTKRVALQNVVRQFASKVAAKATEFNVDHRIAVVGFASGDRYQNQSYNYNNTEVFVGSTEYNYLTVMYEQDGNDIYDTEGYEPLQAMNNSTGPSNVNASIDKLAANGGTLINYGIELANHIFEHDKKGGTRNRVVIVFTDGTPGWSGFDNSVAESAKTEASETKEKHKATVYTVGIFNGADANGTDNVNTFMRDLATTGDGEQQYYLVASNANELEEIFVNISNKIEIGSSGTELNEKTEIRDIVSEFFVPVGAEDAIITIKMADYAGLDSNGNRTWTNEQAATGVTADVVDGTVKVKGFNFSGGNNWVTDIKNNAGQVVGVQGKKLIIEFDIRPKNGFIGGNNVPTNGEASGIYDEYGDLVEAFDIPTVNVPINQPTVDVTDKNVYLLGDLTKEQLYPNGSITVYDVNGQAIPLDPNAANGGLQDWQIAHVNMTITKTPDSDMTNLREDQYFTAAIVIEPKVTNPEFTEGTTAVSTGKIEDTARVYVFKPVLTFDDSKVDYKSTVVNPTDYNANNYEGVVWMHGTTAAPESMGAAPALNLTYTTSTADIDAQNVVVSQDDIPVKVTVALDGENVTGDAIFSHTACEDGAECTFAECTWSETALDGDPAFLLHVVNIYGDLVITKTVSGTPANGVATEFSFRVDLSAEGTFNYTKSDGTSDTISSGKTITLSDGQTVTIFELPPETTYTVTETVPAGYEARQNPVTGAIQAGATVTAAFTNTYTTGNLTVSKQVVGTNPPANETFDFTVKITPAVSGSIGGLVFNNGTATFQLKNGESRTITGLPINAGYTVTETENTAYTTKVNGQSGYVAQGTIDKDGETAAYVNTYKTGSLTITKEFEGCTPEAGETFLFRVKNDDNIIAEVVIKGQGSATIKDLPYGTYTVEEDTGWSWRYTPVEDASQNVTVNSASATVTFTNKVKTDKWLDVNAYAENEWTSSGVELTDDSVNASDGTNG